MATPNRLQEGLTRWRGKTALVTGASAGIGSAVARALAEAGVHLVLAARRAERIKALAEELSSAHGVRVLPVQCDLAKEPEILALFETIRNTGNGLDILVNNAGMNVREAVVDGSTEHWRRVLEVNVLALSVCAREALAQMVGLEECAVVNISSVSAYVPTPGAGSGMYTASKFAVRAFTETLRAELVQAGRKVKLGCVSPGVVETEMREVSGREGNVPAMERNFAPLDAADVADAVLFVLATQPHAQINEVILRPIGQLV